MPDLLAQTTAPTSEPSTVDNIFNGMMKIGNLISKGISFQFGPGDMSIKPMDFGLSGVKATYTLDKANPMDPNVSFWLKAKW